MEGFVTIVMCALEINSTLDCLIYGQAHIETVSGGSMRSVTESIPEAKQNCVHLLPPGTCGTVFVMCNLLGFSSQTYKMRGALTYQTK